MTHLLTFKIPSTLRVEEMFLSLFLRGLDVNELTEVLVVVGLSVTCCRLCSASMKAERNGTGSDLVGTRSAMTGQWIPTSTAIYRLLKQAKKSPSFIMLF